MEIVQLGWIQSTPEYTSTVYVPCYGSGSFRSESLSFSLGWGCEDDVPYLFQNLSAQDQITAGQRRIYLFWAAVLTSSVLFTEAA